MTNKKILRLGFSREFPHSLVEPLPGSLPDGESSSEVKELLLELRRGEGLE